MPTETEEDILLDDGEFAPERVEHAAFEHEGRETSEDGEPEAHERGEMLDPEKQAIVEHVGGSKAEDWGRVAGGDGKWVTDGERIFNPETGESYADGSNPEAALREEGALRHWGESGNKYFVESSWRETTEQGEEVSVIQLILGEPRADGLREVGWSWHKMEIVRPQEEHADAPATSETEAHASEQQWDETPTEISRTPEEYGAPAWIIEHMRANEVVDVARAFEGPTVEARQAPEELDFEAPEVSAGMIHEASKEAMIIGTSPIGARAAEPVSTRAQELNATEYVEVAADITLREDPEVDIAAAPELSHDVRQERIEKPSIAYLPQEEAPVEPEATLVREAEQAASRPTTDADESWFVDILAGAPLIENRSEAPAEKHSVVGTTEQAPAAHIEEIRIDEGAETRGTHVLDKIEAPGVKGGASGSGRATPTEARTSERTEMHIVAAIESHHETPAHAQATHEWQSGEEHKEETPASAAHERGEPGSVSRTETSFSEHPPVPHARASFESQRSGPSIGRPTLSAPPVRTLRRNRSDGTPSSSLNGIRMRMAA